MKIFASWSGEDSKAAAVLFRDWLPNVLQEVAVWVSERDIERGDRWSHALSESLADHKFGLVLLTKTNVTAPWILFEAGALSKSVKSKVVPILLDADELEILKSPLSQLQYMKPQKDQMLDLVLVINQACERRLELERVKRAFEKWWPEFDSRLKSINFKSDPEPAQGDGEPRLARIEDALSSIMRTLRKIGPASSPELPLNNGPKLIIGELDIGELSVFEQLNDLFPGLLSISPVGLSSVGVYLNNFGHEPIKDILQSFSALKAAQRE